MRWGRQPSRQLYRVEDAAPGDDRGSAWYRLIVPQVEWSLMGRDDVVRYDETMQVRKWRDPQGQDYTSPAP